MDNPKRLAYKLTTDLEVGDVIWDKNGEHIVTSLNRYAVTHGIFHPNADMVLILKKEDSTPPANPPKSPVRPNSSLWQGREIYVQDVDDQEYPCSNYWATTNP